jgi:hypothetical protein
MASVADWKTIMASGELVICTEEEARRMKIYPTRYAHRLGHPRVVALVLFQHSNGLFPITKNAMDDATARLKAGELDSVDVVLMRQVDDGEPQFIDARSIN